MKYLLAPLLLLSPVGCQKKFLPDHTLLCEEKEIQYVELLLPDSGYYKVRFVESGNLVTGYYPTQRCMLLKIEGEYKND